jgi:hypothetical protein
MSQEYHLKDFTVGEFKDQNGNTWCSAKWEEFANWTIWVVKDPESVTLGKPYYGRIEDYTNKNGKTKPRFYREQNPYHDSGAGSNEPAVSVPQPKLKAGGVPATDKFLKDTSDLPFRVWTALLPYIDQQQLIKSDAYSKNLNEYVEKQSGILLKMIQDVRDGKVDLLTPKSGYEQAKEVADTLRKEDLDGLFDE